MGSTTSLVARQCRLREWAEQIYECNNRPSNLTVKEWCSQHQITVANYYYRLRQVRMACLDHLPEEVSQNIIPVPSELIENISSPLSSCLEVVVNQACIHVTENTSPELLEMVLRVAANVK